MEDLGAEMKYIVFIIMFSYMYKSIKLRIVKSLPLGGSWLHHPRKKKKKKKIEILQSCTAMLLQQPRMDKPNTGSIEGLSHFLQPL